MADFTRENLAGSRFEEVDLTGARFRNVYLTGAVIRGAVLVNVEIDGLIEDVTINGVDVVPLVEAELDRRYPGRAKILVPAGDHHLSALAPEPPGYGQAQAGGAARDQRALARQQACGPLRRAHGCPV